MHLPCPVIIGILAAGAGTRMRASDPTITDKLLHPVAGAPVLAWTIRCATQSHHGLPITVVIGPDHVGRSEVARDHGAEVIVAPHAERGMRWSLQCLIQYAAARQSALVVLLGDDPIAARALPVIFDQIAMTPDRPTAISRAAAAPHPVYLPVDLVSLFASDPPASEGDHGLSLVLKRHAPIWRTTDSPDLPPVDVDTAFDLAQLATALHQHVDTAGM